MRRQAARNAIITSNLRDSTAHRKRLISLELDCGGTKVGGTMMERKLSIAEILLIAGTRVALGVGMGLLISDRLNRDQRKASGMALKLTEGLTHNTLVLGVFA